MVCRPVEALLKLNKVSVERASSTSSVLRDSLIISTDGDAENDLDLVAYGYNDKIENLIRNLAAKLALDFHTHRSRKSQVST